MTRTAERRPPEALLTEHWLNAHPTQEKGRTAYARARLWALLGEAERAMLLLRQAFDEGLNMRMWVHIDPDFDSLRGMPAYRQLLSPRG